MILLLSEILLQPASGDKFPTVGWIGYQKAYSIETAVFVDFREATIECFITIRHNGSIEKHSHVFIPHEDALPEETFRYRGAYNNENGTLCYFTLANNGGHFVLEYDGAPNDNRASESYIKFLYF